MRTELIIAGAACELVGLAFVLVELMIIRSHELRVPPPWAPLVARRRALAARLRRLLKRPQTVELDVARETDCAPDIDVIRRLPALAKDATDRDRIERIEAYLEDFDSERVAVRRALGEAAVAEAERGDQEIRDEIARREAEQRERLRPSIWRQVFGVGCVGLGIVLGTVANLC